MSRANRNGFQRTRCLRFEALEDRRVLSTVTVSALSDVTDGDTSSIIALIANPGADNKISLREAIDAAEHTGGANEIKFSTVSGDGLNGGTITLTQGEFEITESLTIDASMLTNGLTIDANDTTPETLSDGIRIFNITDTSGGSGPPLVTLIGLTLTGGDPTFSFNAPSLQGGAIRSEGRLVIEGCNFHDNQATYGGAIYIAVSGGDPSTQRDVLTIDEGSVITNNHAFTGAGVYIASGSMGSPTADTFTIRATTISHNRTFESGPGLPIVVGGGIFARLFGAELVIEDSTLEQNEADGEGGGAALETTGNGANDPTLVTITNTRIAGNSATMGRGGGIYQFGENTNLSILEKCVIEGNGAETGGGGIHASSDGGSLDIQSSRITGNHTTTGSGGGIFSAVQSLTLNATEILDNHIAGGPTGGGLHASVTDGLITIEGSIFDINTGSGWYFAGGGAYLNVDNSMVTLTNSIFSNNESLGEEANIAGLGIVASNNSVVWIDKVKITENHAGDDVGGLYILNNGSDVELINSTISGNTASFINGPMGFNYAAGVWIQAYGGAQTTIENSTISGNSTTANADGGDLNGGAGGIFIQVAAGTTTTILNSTISGNVAEGSGGGIKISEPYSSAGGNVFIRHSTITNNRADSDDNDTGTGGGIDIGYSLTNVTIDHTIIAGNFRGIESTPDDVSHALFGPSPLAAMWSLIGDGTGAIIDDIAGNLIGNVTVLGPIDPLLAPLAWNGGPTETHALLAGSPAIDAGDPSATGLPTYDQRGEGFLRKYGSAVDIGAYEIGLAKVIQVVVSGSSSTHAPYDFAGVVGSGEQIRTVPVGGADTIQIRFSEAVTASSGDVTVQSAITSSFYSGSLTMSADGKTATWQLTSGVFVADQIVLHVDDGITGLIGALDGEWTNPTSLTATGTSTFPSGNGTAGGDFVFYFTVLSGDFGRNNMIDASDWVLWQKWSGKTSGALFKQGDADGDGDVDQTDYNIWRSEFGLDFTVWPT